jgi:predicted Zn-dependent peptidase
MSFLNV